MKLFGSALVFCLILSCEKNTQSIREDYNATLKIHLEAIQNRDLNAILETVHDSVTLIFPDGQLLKSKEKFADFHRDWFADKKWSMNPVVLKTNQSDSLSYSLIRYQYNDLDSLGNAINPRSTYLMLTFKLESNGWKLIHDQNTRIQP